MGLITAALSRLPAWLIAIAAVAAWGAWHRYSALRAHDVLVTAQRDAQAATARQQAAAGKETARRIDVITAIADQATERARTLDADRARLRTERDRLRVTLADQQRGASHPAAAGVGPPAAADTGVRADVLGQCVERVAVLAGEADATRSAGTACQRAYDALTR